MVKKLAILVAALTLLAGVTPAVADGNAPPVPLRVATYNIHAGAGHDNVFDLDRTEATLRALDADVIGLQEVDVHWGARSQWRDLITELADRLGMRAGFAPIYDFDPPAPVSRGASTGSRCCPRRRSCRCRTTT